MGWVCHNRKSGSQVKVLVCQVSDMMDIWCGPSAVSRGQVEMRSGAWERDLGRICRSGRIYFSKRIASKTVLNAEI